MHACIGKNDRLKGYSTFPNLHVCRRLSSHAIEVESLQDPNKRDGRIKSSAWVWLIYLSQMKDASSLDEDEEVSDCL